jgi:hypothetical protein
MTCLLIQVSRLMRNTLVNEEQQIDFKYFRLLTNYVDDEFEFQVDFTS